MFHRAPLLTPGALLALFANIGIFAAASAPAQATAADAAPDRRGPPRHPPEQAVTACRDHSEGDACSFSMHDHTLDGTCKPAPSADDGTDSGVLACMPEPPAPPPEAVSACANLNEGDACTVQLDDRSLQGVCSSKQDGALFCRPEHPPRD